MVAAAHDASAPGPPRACTRTALRHGAQGLKPQNDYVFCSALRLPGKRWRPMKPNYRARPSTAWNIDWRAWLTIWPFHTSVSV